MTSTTNPSSIDDLYARLKVGHEATEEEIKRAFKKASHKWHPDKNHSPGAEEEFKAINEAYDTLTDEARRRAYDIRWNTDHSSSAGPGFAGSDSAYDSTGPQSSGSQRRSRAGSSGPSGTSRRRKSTIDDFATNGSSTQGNDGPTQNQTGQSQYQTTQPSVFSKGADWAKEHKKPIMVAGGIGLAAVIAKMLLGSTDGVTVGDSISYAAQNVSQAASATLANPYFQFGVSGALSGIGSYFVNKPNASGRSIADEVDNKIPPLMVMPGYVQEESPHVPRTMIVGGSVWGISLFSGFPGNIPLTLGAMVGYKVGEAVRNYRTR